MQGGEPEQPLEGLRVLVLEDNFVVARSIKWVLETMGCVVVGPAPSAERALAILEAEELAVDAGILDIDLHGDTSEPVATALSESGIPIVFLTGYESADRLPDFLRELPCLSKPLDARKVVDAILSERRRLAARD